MGRGKVKALQPGKEALREGVTEVLNLAGSGKKVRMIVHISHNTEIITQPYNSFFSQVCLNVQHIPCVLCCSLTALSCIFPTYFLGDPMGRHQLV